MIDLFDAYISNTNNFFFFPIKNVVIYERIIFKSHKKKKVPKCGCYSVLPFFYIFIQLLTEYSHVFKKMTSIECNDTVIWDKELKSWRVIVNLKLIRDQG